MKVIDTLTRVFVHDIDVAVHFYEEVLGKSCGMRFSYAEAGLKLAQVGSILIIAGSDEALAPLLETRMTFLVDSVEEWRSELLGKGAHMVRDAGHVPTGYNMTLRHPDGMVVEYVQHDDRA